MVAVGITATLAAPVVVGAALGAAGFGAAGVGAGTLAAGIQSGIGNVVAGSLFAGTYDFIKYGFDQTDSFCNLQKLFDKLVLKVISFPKPFIIHRIPKTVTFKLKVLSTYSSTQTYVHVTKTRQTKTCSYQM